MSTVQERFAAAMEPFAGHDLLVALSGGADSVCLLELAAEYAKETGAVVKAAHLNHCLRGEESDRDEAFCRALCEARGIPLVCEKADIPADAKALGLGIEEAARNARYAFLARVCPTDGYILTAHHQNDLCETMLLNLTRGSGLHGLCSIPARRGNILRPLLAVRREEILTYNAEHKLAYVTDSSNADTAFARNRIRKNVIPELCDISTAAVQNMARTASLLAADEDYLSQTAAQFLAKQGKSGVIDTENAQKLHTAILSRALRMVYTQCGYKNLSEVHVRALCDLIHAGKRDFVLSLPQSAAICERGVLTFRAGVQQAAPFDLPATLDNLISLPNGKALLLTKQPPQGELYPVFPIARDALYGNLTVTSRKEGDTVICFGKTHKIKRMIADKKCTAEEKNGLFFLRRDGEILFSNLPLYADEAYPKAGIPVYYMIIL